MKTITTKKLFFALGIALCCQCVVAASAAPAAKATSKGLAKAIGGRVIKENVKVLSAKTAKEVSQELIKKEAERAAKKELVKRTAPAVVKEITKPKTLLAAGGAIGVIEVAKGAKGLQDAMGDTIRENPEMLDKLPIGSLAAMPKWLVALLIIILGWGPARVVSKKLAWWIENRFLEKDISSTGESKKRGAADSETQSEPESVVIDGEFTIIQ